MEYEEQEGATVDGEETGVMVDGRTDDDWLGDFSLG